MPETSAHWPLLPWQALLKALSLGYLLGLLGMALSGTLWLQLRQSILPAQRASIGSKLLLGAALLQSVLALAIWRGVVTHKIRMTTMYFHRLMHGEWSVLLTCAGLSVLAASLVLAAWSYRRGQVPPRREQRLSLPGALPVYAATGVGTAALVGVFHPQIWVNPQWWEQLDPAAQQLALDHELEHWRCGDNWTKLLLEWLAVFYAVLPAARRWLADFELDCELAADAVCVRRHGLAAYQALLGNALNFMLAQRSTGQEPTQAAISSALGSRGLRVRLERLADATPAGDRARLLSTLALGWLLSLLPGLLMLSHPLTRCFLACYLGY